MCCRSWESCSASAAVRELRTWSGCPGHNPANTRFVSQPRRRLSHDWQFSRVWEAEDFLPEQSELNTLSGAVSRRLLVADLEPEPGNEILLHLDAFSGILNRHGVIAAARPNRVSEQLSVGPGPDGRTALIACSPMAARIYSVSPPGTRAVHRVALAAPATEAWLVSVPETQPGARQTSGRVLRLITVESDRLQTAADGVPAEVTTLAGYSLTSGSEGAQRQAEPDDTVSVGKPLWRYETGASQCHVWAIADVNDDSEPELIVGTMASSTASA